MNLTYHDDHHILSKEDEMPSLAPASVNSVESSHGARELDESMGAESLPKVIETQKKVSFGDINFRSYPVILGDHPDCIGPPLSFDWDFVRDEHCDLELYEAERAPRRHEEELVLGWMLRKRILRCYGGVSEFEIFNQTQDCARIRKQREHSKKRLTWKTSMRYLMAKVSGGLLGEKRSKYTDQQVGLKRFRGPPLVTDQ